MKNQLSQRKKSKPVSKARIYGLVESVAYNTQAIVSKTVIRKDAGNVTLFSFDKTQSISAHTVPFDALVYAMSGRAKIKIKEKSYSLNAGQYIILPAGKPHSVSAITRFKMMLVMIKK